MILPKASTYINPVLIRPISALVILLTQYR